LLRTHATRATHKYNRLAQEQLSKEQGVQVSDTTGLNQWTNAGPIIVFLDSYN